MMTFKSTRKKYFCSDQLHIYMCLVIRHTLLNTRHYVVFSFIFSFVILPSFKCPWDWLHGLTNNSAVMLNKCLLPLVNWGRVCQKVPTNPYGHGERFSWQPIWTCRHVMLKQNLRHHIFQKSKLSYSFEKWEISASRSSIYWLALTEPGRSCSRLLRGLSLPLSPWHWI